MSYVKCILIIVGCWALFNSPLTAYTDENDPDSPDERLFSENIFHYSSGRQYLTGDWNGVRTKLENWGLTTSIFYDVSFLGNPIGGENQAFRYAGLMDAFLEFDLEKILNIKRTKFVISGSWASGKSLSDEDIGNFFTVSAFFSGETANSAIFNIDTFRLYQLYIESDLIEDKLNVAIGRLGIGDDFSSSELYENYLNTAINSHPISFDYNDLAFFSDPLASWAVRLRVHPREDFYIMAGVYNANPELGLDNSRGVDFSFKEGVIIAGEIGYKLNQLESSAGLPGNYKFGMFYDTGEFPILSDDTDSRNGNTGMYWLIDQMVYRESPEGDQGLTPWAAFTINFPAEVNLFPFFASGGLIYEGLFATRDYDTTSVGFAYGYLNKDLEDSDYELMLELTHIFKMNAWLNIQPDIQYIIHPGGSNEIPNALVIGMALSLSI